MHLVIRTRFVFSEMVFHLGKKEGYTFRISTLYNFDMVTDKSTQLDWYPRSVREKFLFAFDLNLYIVYAQTVLTAVHVT